MAVAAKLIIRPAVESDAQSFLDLWNVLDTETEFLLFEPNERKQTLKQQRSNLVNATTSDNVHILAAIEPENNELVGFAAGRRSALQRDRHSLEMVVALKQIYTGRGEGQRLLAELEHWAIEKQIHRLELSVMANNPHAIKLYEKCGYVREGTKKDAVRLNSGYVDLHLMGKIIG